MTDLNEQQRQAVEFIDGIASVVAVAGSGKTLTMTQRIGTLVKKHGVAPESILGLTFTKNAANAMKERLNQILTDKAVKVSLSTIHSFCYTLLKNEGRVFEILNGKEQIRFIQKLLQKFKIKSLPIGMVLREISLAKNNLIGVAEYRSLYDGDDMMLKIGDIYEAYENGKKEKLYLDFDDLLIETHNLLKFNQEVKEKYQSIYRHILVDEFQDTNPAQMELLKLLISSNGDRSSFWICGDDWQSIYAFTGASVGNILNFKKMFPESQEFLLNMNYRSTPQILRACQNLIQHNLRKIDKQLVTINADGEEIKFVSCSNEEDEAKSIGEIITELVQQKGYRHKDVAVLYRANYQSRTIEESFSQSKIPYHIENGITFYQRYEVKTLVDYLRLINDPDSEEGDEALKSCINIPNRYLGKKFISELEAHAETHLYRGLKTLPVKVPYLRKNIKEFILLIDPLIEVGKTMEPSEMLHLLRESLDYDSFISEDDIPTPDDSRIANIDQLMIVANKHKTIQSLLTYADSFKEETSKDKNGVSLMTIHKSKGLEFPVVFVIGWAEGVLPNNNGDIEEERRIAFVGMSRAMKLLYLTWSLGKTGKRSSFIEEINGKIE